MAGFRGIPPTRETVELILGNLLRARQDLAAQALLTDPFATDDKGHMRLVDKVHLNAALGEVFVGLLDGTTQVFPFVPSPERGQPIP